MLRTLTEGAEFSQSVNFYSDLVRAKSIAYPVAAKPYRTTAGETKTLAQIYGIKEKDPRVANARAGNVLIDNISSSIYSRSGVDWTFSWLDGSARRETDSPATSSRSSTRTVESVDSSKGRRSAYS